MRYFLPLLLLPGVAHAADVADAGETIVVTATRSEQPLSRVGQSISVIDANKIATRQSASVAELLQDLPSVAETKDRHESTPR